MCCYRSGGWPGGCSPDNRPPVTDEQHNERVLYAEMFFQAIAGAGAFSFTSVFLVRLGAPNYLVGLLSSLPALMIILTVLPAGAFVQRQRDLVKAGQLVAVFRIASLSGALAFSSTCLPGWRLLSWWRLRA